MPQNLISTLLKCDLFVFCRPFGRQERKKCSVIIVGAGLAGLGAARELIAAGISDIVILEGKFDHCLSILSLN